MTEERNQAAIIQAALEATTDADAIRVSRMIESDIGAAFQRPVGDRWNNYGLMASSGSYDYKAIEPVTNAQDADIERLAVAKFGDLSKVPHGSPQKAARDLLGHLPYREQADRVKVSFRESDPPTRSTKRLTIVYRDAGCGMEASAVPQTIFALGSSHKTESAWLQGAFGIGGASTYRNAKAIVLVTRRAPEMKPVDDRIVVAVIRWESHGKGETAFYLTTTDWADGGNPAAEPWSSPATSYPEFEPGTHLALISYGVEGFHRARSGDERAFDLVLNTRLYRPVIPVRFTNEITRGKNEYLRGLARRLEENPSKDRVTDEEEMLYTFGGTSYRLPIRYVVFPGGDTGTRRRFVAKDHGVIFTSNGQVHHNWTPTEFKQRTKLTKVHERVFAEVETDALPIELRTRLFTPDRSQLLANDPAIQLEDQVADFLANWDRLIEVNNDLIRDAISGAGSEHSGLDVARKIATALKLKGFHLGGAGGAGGGGGIGGARTRRKVETYPDPTTLEGPDRLIVEDGKVRLLSYMLNARDDFLDSGRGALEFDCDHPDIDPQKHIVAGRLRDGYVRVQLQVPEGSAEGTYRLTCRLLNWHKASGGMGPELSYTTKLEVVDEITAPRPGAGSKKGKSGSDEGPNVAVIWETPDTWQNGWHNGIPGSVEEIPAKVLAEKREEYAMLATRGETKVPTVVLNGHYAPYKRYIDVRAKELTEQGVNDTRDRYAVGLGLGLLLLNEENEKRAKEGKQAIDADVEVAGQQAVARSVLLMMPSFDALMKEAGLETV